MAKNNVLNHNQMKKMNMQIVLDILRRRGKMSRAELARLLNCDGTTITNIIRSLANLNLIVSHGSVSGASPGRPKELLTLNTDAGYCVGLSFEPDLIYGLVVDLSGKIILRRQVHYEIDITQAEFLALLKRMSVSLFNDIAGKRLLGVGIATFGPLDPKSKVISGSKLFPAVNNLNVQDYFYKSFKLLPEVINTSAARALTEIWHDSRPAEQKDFILLDAGVGIGAVIVKKGVIIDWQDEYLGEFGHTIVCPGGKTCTCGLKGCLETVSSIPAIKEGAAAALGRKSITFDSVIEHYQAGDQAIMKVVDNSAEYLGLGIANLINLLVPDKIIISGSLFELGNSYICKLQRIVDESTFPLFRKKGVLMQQSIYREEAAAIGAATLSLNKFFTTFHSEKFKNKEDIRAKELAM